MKVNVFGAKYRIKIMEGLTASTGNAGYCDTTQKVLAVDSSLNEHERMICILHELVHAVFERIGLNQTELSHDAQEIICESVATAIAENFAISLKASK